MGIRKPPEDLLVRTSVQLPPGIVELLDRWPGKTRSQALREVLERYFAAAPTPEDAYLHPLAWVRAVCRRDDGPGTK
jgi:hypothetical protein